MYVHTYTINPLRKEPVFSVALATQCLRAYTNPNDTNTYCPLYSITNGYLANDSSWSKSASIESVLGAESFLPATATPTGPPPPPAFE